MKKNRVHGTPEQFEAALKNKIQKLGGSIQDDVTSAVEIDDNKKRYIHTLIGDIQSEFKGTVDSMKFDTTDDSLIITVVFGNEVKEFTVPYSDLKFDWNNIDEDTQYISNEIDEEFNREYADDVISESSVNSRSSKFSKVLGSEDDDYDDDDDDYDDDGDDDDVYHYIEYDISSDARAKYADIDGTHITWISQDSDYEEDARDIVESFGRWCVEHNEHMGESGEIEFSCRSSDTEVYLSFKITPTGAVIDEPELVETVSGYSSYFDEEITIKVYKTGKYYSWAAFDEAGSEQTPDETVTDFKSASDAIDDAKEYFEIDDEEDD